ncbi:dynamin family protein [Myroides sp. C8-3]|uniref:dynamin family protein n=1 Tax=Myroides sp. C8-3 TaxID=3400533 RepID=UPI003D2F7895
MNRMRIDIDYNTFSFKALITCTNDIIFKNLQQTIKETEGKRITEWFEGFINSTLESINRESFSISIKGCDTYEANIIQEILNLHKDLAIQSQIDIKSEQAIEVCYNQIDNFINYLLESDEAIIQESINPHKKSFNRLKDAVITVPVIATMSSGKSTLLNALIGKDYLHEDSGATTATTCTILANRDKEKFEATIFEDDLHKESTEENISAFIAKWNAEANNTQKRIHLKLEGNISEIESYNFNLAFVDTPGPNSSNHCHHKEKTFEYLKENEKLPIVLYVLDLEKIDSNDDDFVIREISEVFKENKQSLDRILFIVNKIDREDVENKTMESHLEKVKNFLLKYEIKNPKIFPISAHYAKLAQLDNLTRNERGALEKYRRDFTPDIQEGYNAYELVKYSSLKVHQKQLLLDRLNTSDEQIEKDLILSGIKALQEYIQDYISNHHRKHKYNELEQITDSVYNLVLSRIDHEKKSYNSLSVELKLEYEQIKKKEFAKLQLKLDKLNQEINLLDTEQFEFIKYAAIKVDKTLSKENVNFMNKGEIEKREALEILKRLDTNIKNLSMSVKTSLESQINTYLQQYVRQLKQLTIKQFRSRDELPVDIKFFNYTMINNITSIKIDELYKYERQQVSIEKQEVRSRWAIKRLFGFTDTQKKEITTRCVNITSFYNEEFMRLQARFKAMIEEYEEEFKNTRNEIKETFKQAIINLYNSSKEEIYKNHSVSSFNDKTILEEILTDLESLENQIQVAKKGC